MAQIIVANGIGSSGGWSGFTVGNLNTQNDSLGCFCTGGASQGYVETGLSGGGEPLDPLSSSNHVLKFRAYRDGDITETASITLTLKQGTTTIATTTQLVDRSAFSNKTYTLSSSEANAITDYTALRFYLSCSDSWGQTVYLDYAELSIPDLALPSQVTGLNASDGTFTNKTALTWNSASGATSYKVFRNTTNSIPGSPIASGITGTSYDDTTGTSGTVYYYWVKGTNGAGDGPASTSNTGYRQALPAVPGSFSASDGTYPTKVALTWAAASGADTYKIYRNTVNSVPGSPLVSGISNLYYDDTTVSQGVTYYYWIRGTNEAGDGSLSSVETGYAQAATQNLSPTTIASEEYIANPQIDLYLQLATSIDTAESFGTPLVTWDRIVVDTIPSEEIVSNVVINQGTYIPTIYPNGIPSEEAFGSPLYVLNPPQYITDPNTITTAEAFGTPKIAQGIIVDTIDDGEVGIPTILPGPVYIILDEGFGGEIYDGYEFGDGNFGIPVFRNFSNFFKDNLLRFLPVEFEIRDSTIQDLEPFLHVVAIPLDDFATFIDEFTSIFDVDNCDPKYLPYLAKMLNYDLSDRDSEYSKRKQLKNAVEWYRRKGINEAFRILFYSLGYSINLVELWTRDYKKFFRYPGKWLPKTKKPTITGTLLISVPITSTTKNLRINVNGSEVFMALQEGTRNLTDVADEIDAVISEYGASCTINGNGRIQLQSNIVGEFAFIRLINVTNPCYETLGFNKTSDYGIDYEVESTYYELLENGGQWFKTPHFGIEVFSIRNHAIDDGEFAYIRERIETIRPVHTVLDYIKLIKSLSENPEISEGDFIAEIDALLPDSWPFPLCYDRGYSREFVYLRDGLRPSRDVGGDVTWGHYRKVVIPTVMSRDGFDYTVFNLTREYPSGPVQMNDRSIPRYYRSGYYFGEPHRSSCAVDQEDLDADLMYEEERNWETLVLRGAGLVTRDQSYTRNGEFTAVTWRGQSEFTRSDAVSAHDGFTREIDKPPIEVETGLILYTNDYYPGILFRNPPLFRVGLEDGSGFLQQENGGFLIQEKGPFD